MKLHEEFILFLSSLSLSLSSDLFFGELKSVWHLNWISIKRILFSRIIIEELLLQTFRSERFARVLYNIGYKTIVVNDNDPRWKYSSKWWMDEHLAHKERLLDYSTKVSSTIFPSTSLRLAPNARVSPPGLFNPTSPSGILCSSSATLYCY